jgi:hypothetical protein
MFVERRRTRRLHSKQRGSVIVDEGVRRFCDITNVSADGACIEMGAHAPLPTRFLLVFADGRRFHCQRVWQEGMIAGVQFAKVPLWKRLVGTR